MFTEGLARFIAGSIFEDLPENVVAAAKNAILDFIGVAMAGSQEPSGRIIDQTVRETRSPEEATVIGHRYKTNRALAAMVNGTAGHVLDYDDCLDMPECGLGHPSTSIVPALLAVGEKNRMNGKDILVAYCMGLEAYAKIGLIIRDAFRGGQRWEWTGVLGAMGSAAALARLLRLDEPRTAMCLGIASSLSCGIIRNFGSMAGHLHAGNAARNGIEAALLAQKGFTAHNRAIEASHGYYNTLTGHSDPLSEKTMNEMLQKLGNPWNLIKPGLMFKAFPCAHISHFGVTAALELMRNHDIDWQQISEIEFRIPSVVNQVVWYPDPQTGIEGKFSLGYCLCRTLIEGKIRIDHFTDQAVHDPVTRQLMDKIKWVILEQDLKKNPFGFQEVALKMADGSVHETRVDHAKGEPQNPHTAEEFSSKYLDCAAYAHYDEKTARQIQELVLSLEELDDISIIGELLCQ